MTSAFVLTSQQIITLKAPLQGRKQQQQQKKGHKKHKMNINNPLLKDEQQKFVLKTIHLHDDDIFSGFYFGYDDTSFDKNDKVTKSEQTPTVFAYTHTDNTHFIYKSPILQQEKTIKNPQSIKGAF